MFNDLAYYIDNPDESTVWRFMFNHRRGVPQQVTLYRHGRYADAHAYLVNAAVDMGEMKPCSLNDVPPDATILPFA